MLTPTHLPVTSTPVGSASQHVIVVAATTTWWRRSSAAVDAEHKEPHMLVMVENFNTSGLEPSFLPSVQTLHILKERVTLVFE